MTKTNGESEERNYQQKIPNERVKTIFMTAMDRNTCILFHKKKQIGKMLECENEMK